MELHEYETKFIKSVNQTYAMLKELDDANNDDDFWKIYDNIKAGFAEIETARRCYYTILKNEGSDTQNCSLSQELINGLYFLDDKYLEILDRITEISGDPN